MPYPDERLCNPISLGELERRWRAVRAAMADNGLDALVVQGGSNHGRHRRLFPLVHRRVADRLLSDDGDLSRATG